MGIEDAFFFTPRQDKSKQTKNSFFPSNIEMCRLVSDPIQYLLQSQTKQRWVSKKVVQI